MIISYRFKSCLDKFILYWSVHLALNSRITSGMALMLVAPYSKGTFLVSLAAKSDVAQKNRYL